MLWPIESWGSVRSVHSSKKQFHWSLHPYLVGGQHVEDVVVHLRCMLALASQDYGRFLGYAFDPNKHGVYGEQNKKKGMFFFRGGRSKHGTHPFPGGVRTLFVTPCCLGLCQGKRGLHLGSLHFWVSVPTSQRFLPNSRAEGESKISYAWAPILGGKPKGGCVKQR